MFTRGACSCGCLRALVLALWWGGGGSVVPPPLITFTVLWRVGFWCSRFGVWALLACAGLLRCGSNGNGAGQRCPAPYSVALPPLRCVQEKGWGALVVC